MLISTPEHRAKRRIAGVDDRLSKDFRKIRVELGCLTRRRYVDQSVTPAWQKLSVSAEDMTSTWASPMKWYAFFFVPLSFHRDDFSLEIDLNQSASETHSENSSKTGKVC